MKQFSVAVRNAASQVTVGTFSGDGFINEMPTSPWTHSLQHPNPITPPVTQSNLILYFSFQAAPGIVRRTLQVTSLNFHCVKSAATETDCY